MILNWVFLQHAKYNAKACRMKVPPARLEKGQSLITLSEIDLK